MGCHGVGCTFGELADICAVFETLPGASGAIDRELVRQLASFQILRDDSKVTLPKWLPYQTMLAPLAASRTTSPF